MRTLLALLLLCVSPALAADPLAPLVKVERRVRYVEASLAPTPADASYRIAAPDQGGTSYGSGTAIGPNAVVTNDHVVSHALKQVTLIDRHGGRKRAKVIYSDSEADICLLWCDDGGLSWVPLAESDPAPGEQITKLGFGGSGVLRATSGVVHPGGLARSQRVRSIESTAWTESGDSGGGWFNASGELCAVTWGADPRTSGGVSTPQSYVRAAVTHYETQLCQGGSCQILGGQSRPRPIVQQPIATRPPRNDPYNPAPEPNPPPSPRPPAVAAPQPSAPGCACDGSAACKCSDVDKCKCDASAACKCDGSGKCGCDTESLASILAKLEQRQSQLEESVAVLSIAKAEPGPPGPPGEPAPPPDPLIVRETIEQTIRSKLGVMVSNSTQSRGLFSLGICAVGLVSAAVLWKK